MSIEHTEAKFENIAKKIAETKGNFVILGYRGTGKTLIASRVAKYLPPMHVKEEMQVHRIYTCALIKRKREDRPFRAPHHTVSAVGMCGKRPDPVTAYPHYGELSLAHNGVLFLDELIEFRKDVINYVAIAVRDGKVTHGTKSGNVSYPTNFKLIVTVDPCPCGHRGNPKQLCRCTQSQIDRYMDRVNDYLNLLSVTHAYNTVTNVILTKDEFYTV